MLVFALPRAMPGDPLAAALEPGNPNLGDPAVRAALQSYYGLDRSLPDQFGHFLANLAHGDLGVSIAQRVPVSSLIRSHLPWTLLLMGTALALASASATWPAWGRRGGGGGAGTRRSSVDQQHHPGGAQLRAGVGPARAPSPSCGRSSPSAGRARPFAAYSSPLDRLADVASHLALPALRPHRVALRPAACCSSATRWSGPSARTTWSWPGPRACPSGCCKYRHAGRNALLPFLTLVGLQAGIAVGGAIFIESVFAYPGMGTLVLRAIEARDYPVLEGTFLVLALVVLAANVTVDLLYARLDPGRT